MSGKTEFVMPSAAEQLRAEEAMLRIDWDRLHAMVEAQAEALIPFLVQCVVAAWEWDGSSDPVGGECVPEELREHYSRAARVLGIL